MGHKTVCGCGICIAIRVNAGIDAEEIGSYQSRTDIVMEDGTRIKAGARFVIAENRSNTFSFYLRLSTGESWKVHLNWILSKGIVAA